MSEEDSEREREREREREMIQRQAKNIHVHTCTWPGQPERQTDVGQLVTTNGMHAANCKHNPISVIISLATRLVRSAAPKEGWAGV